MKEYNAIILQGGKLQALIMPEPVDQELYINGNHVYENELIQALGEYEESIKKAKAEAIDFRPEDYKIWDNMIQFFISENRHFTIDRIKEGEIYPKPDGFEIEIVDHYEGIVNYKRHYSKYARMGKDSLISWCNHTWNPWQGCVKVSPGCKFCYMYRDKQKYGQDPKDIHRSADATFFKPLQWKDPALVFTCSWSDWFIELADEWRNDAYGVIRKTPHLTYQILTKRIERVSDHLPKDWGEGYDNVWIGASIENQDYVGRITWFADFKAKVKFLSVQPLLGPVDLKLNGINEGLVSWVIIGGESGNDGGDYRYRPCRLEWIESLINQCYQAGVPVFVKQLGTHLAKEMGLKDRHGGEMNEWPEWLRVRQMPKT